MPRAILRNSARNSLMRLAIYRYWKKEKNTREKAALEPHHTHFLLVDNPEMTWGGEVKLRAKLEDALEEYYTVPCVAIVLGGGVGTFDNVYEMLQRDNPVLVVKESRGCAMAVAEFYEAHCAAVQKLEGRQTLTEDELKEMVSKIEIPAQKMMSSEKARRAIPAQFCAVFFPQFCDAHSTPIQAREKLGVIAETLQKFINQEPPLIYVYSDSSKPFEQARAILLRARNSRATLATLGAILRRPTHPRAGDPQVDRRVAQAHAQARGGQAKEEGANGEASRVARRRRSPPHHRARAAPEVRHVTRTGH